MDRIAPRWREAILADETLSVTNASLRGHLASWLQGMTDQTYIKMTRELGIQLKSDKGCHTRSKLMNIMSTEEGSEGSGGSDDSRAGSTAGAAENGTGRRYRPLRSIACILFVRSFLTLTRCFEGGR